MLTREQQSFPSLEVQFVKGETHDQLFMDPVVGEKVVSDSAKIIKSWILARLKGDDKAGKD